MAGLIAAVALFVIELVALALGWFTVAIVCGAIFFAGWFALRWFMKRGEPAPPS